MTNRKIQYWVIPPDADAEFAACMEDVLEIYARPYNAAFPGWRKVSARPRRTKVDWAFEAHKARELVRRIDWQFTMALSNYSCVQCVE